jgi:D-alanyl-D-alanine carboxypeptidase
VLKGQKVGTVKVTLDGKPVDAYPLLALADVAPASLFGRAWDTVRLWFK